MPVNSNYFNWTNPPPYKVEEVGHEVRKQLFLFNILYQNLNWKLMFAALHSDMNSPSLAAFI